MTRFFLSFLSNVCESHLHLVGCTRTYRMTLNTVETESVSEHPCRTTIAFQYVVKFPCIKEDNIKPCNHSM